MFTVIDYVYKNRTEKQKIFRRIKTDKSINMLIQDLVSQNWDMIYNEKDVDGAYNIFLEIFKAKYDKHCPIRMQPKKEHMITVHG